MFRRCCGAANAASVVRLMVQRLEELVEAYEFAADDAILRAARDQEALDALARARGVDVVDGAGFARVVEGADNGIPLKAYPQ